SHKTLPGSGGRNATESRGSHSKKFALTEISGSGTPHRLAECRGWNASVRRGKNKQLDVRLCRNARNPSCPLPRGQSQLESQLPFGNVETSGRINMRARPGRGPTYGP